MEKFKTIVRNVGMLLFTRGLPVLTLAILFGVVAVQFDKWQITKAPASEFINYTAFDVQNARAKEDVYFKLCRTHQENYTYAGALTVYIYRDVDPKGTPTKVYAKDIGGSIRTECENKVLRASDFAHTAGTYKMAFCVDFRVKYDIQKTACKESNIYKIYPQPTDINDQLRYYQDQIDMLRRQQNDTAVNSPSSMELPQDSNLRSDTAARPSSIGTPAPTPTQTNDGMANNGGSGSNGNSAGNTPATQSCSVNLFGLLRAFCQ